MNKKVIVATYILNLLSILGYNVVSFLTLNNIGKDIHLYHYYNKEFISIPPYQFQLCLVLPQVVSFFLVCAMTVVSLSKNKALVVPLQGALLINAIMLLYGGLSMNFYDGVLARSSKLIDMSYQGNALQLLQLTLTNLILFRLSYVLAYICAANNVLYVIVTHF